MPGMVARSNTISAFDGTSTLVTLYCTGGHQGGKLACGGVGGDGDGFYGIVIAATHLGGALHLLACGFIVAGVGGVFVGVSTTIVLAHHIHAVGIACAELYHGLANVGLALCQTKGLALFNVATCHTAGYYDFGHIGKVHRLFLHKGVACANALVVGGETACRAKLVALLLYLYKVVANGHTDAEAALAVAGDGFAVLIADVAVYVEVATLHRIGGAFVQHLACDGEA